MAKSPPSDPIGDASARLFAIGIGGRDRLLALRFLGILLAQAGYDGRVHGGPYDLLGLGLFHGMEADEVERSRRSLEAAGVLDPEPGGWWRIRNFAPVGDDEVPPAEVMAMIGRVLGKEVEAPAPVDTAPAAPLSPDITPVPVPSHSRFSPRWVAAPAGIAAAVLVVALVLSGQTPISLPGQTAGNSRENAQQVASELSATSSSEPEAAGSPPGSARGGVPASTGPAAVNAAPAGTPTQASVACPPGGVLVAVEKVEQNVNGSVPSSAPEPQLRADLPPIVGTTASGVLRNTSTVPAVAAPFPVEVTFTDGSGTTTATVTAVALSAPVTVAPGQTLAWSVVVRNPERTPFPASAKAGGLSWRWEDAALAAACRH